MKSNWKRNNIKRSIILLISIYACLTIVINCLEVKLLPIPVVGAKSGDWNINSFWFYPWGNNRVHKGIDIFAPHRTDVISPTSGLVILSGYNENGGNYIYIIGPWLRIYYFAHLSERIVDFLDPIKANSCIGKVGNTGNAISKPYHLHYSISSLVPILKNGNLNLKYGLVKMFYLNPTEITKN